MIQLNSICFLINREIIHFLRFIESSLEKTPKTPLQRMLKYI